MNAAAFELNVVLPHDARFADAMRDLAAHAARYAGCRGADADLYGAAVQAAVLGCLQHGVRADVPVVVRRANGPVEFLIACDHRFDLDIARDAQIVIGWIREPTGQMCRVARLMPAEAPICEPEP